MLFETMEGLEELRLGNSPSASPIKSYADGLDCVLRAPWLRNATNGATGTERNNKDKETQTTRGDESRREKRIYRIPPKKEKKKKKR